MADIPDVAPIDSTLSPAAVAMQVVDAIFGDRFWILTHAAYRDALEQRLHVIVETGEVVVPGLY